MLLQQYNIGLGYDRAHISGFQYKLCAVRWNTYCLSVLKIFRVQFNVKAILLCRILCNLSRALHAIQPTSRSNGLIMCRHCFLASDRFAKRFIENAVCNKIRSKFKSVLFFSAFSSSNCQSRMVVYNVIWRHIRVVKHAKQS